MEKLAEEIYTALLGLLKETKSMALLSAVSDAKEGLPYAKAAPKTREVFLALAENLTKVQARR
jgi:hypothetical protein